MPLKFRQRINSFRYFTATVLLIEVPRVPDTNKSIEEYSSEGVHETTIALSSAVTEMSAG